MRCIPFALLFPLLAVNLAADLLVSRGTQGVDRYTNDGTFVGQIIAPGSGGLTDARGIAVAPNGDILVGDWALGQILRYDAAGSFQSVFSSDPAIGNPFSLVFGTAGDLFVASAGADSNVARLDANTGAVLDADFTFGNATPIGGPQYISFGTNNVLYLTDIAGHLFRFNATTGQWISNASYDNPEGVAYGPDDQTYVAQRISDNVLRVPPLGGPADVVIPMGAFAGAPADLKFGPNGDLYLSASQIYRFDVSGANGVLVDTFGTGGQFITFYQPIPEPSTWVLALSGMAAAIAFRKRRA